MPFFALKVKAQLELGKRTRNIAKDTTFHGNRYSDSQPVADTKKGKWDELAEIGLSHQRASEYERMKRERDYQAPLPGYQPFAKAATSAKVRS